jgi:hypothetical protein
MSTEYPEVSGDESGIVPPQSARASEWPKKLRTLTAAELDRLTIDNAGRFYWDGKLVNYDTGPKQLSDNTADPLDRSMDILDRAALDLGARPAQNTIEGELASLDLSPRRSEPSPIDFDIARVQAAPPAPDLASDQGIRSAEPTRLTLTRLQTVGAVVVVVAIVIGAIGMATYGYVAAVEWGCKTSTARAGCPVPAAAPHRPDIPA